MDNSKITERTRCTGKSITDKIYWIKKFLGPSATTEECLEALEIYQQYRSEGQSDIVSRQYAGLI